MGFIRGSLHFFAGFLLFFSLFAGSLSLNFMLSLQDYQLNSEGQSHFSDYVDNPAVLEQIENEINSRECESFFECLFGFINSMFSEDAGKFWAKTFYISLIISLAMIVLVFFLSEQKTNFLFLAGVFLIFVSLPALIIKYLLSFVENSFFGFLSILFSRAGTVFVIYVLFGLIFIMLGMGMKFLNLSYFFSDKINKIMSRRNKEQKPKIKNNRA
ncbi:MAG: hypothetical protein ABIH49_02020 [archaeon]